MLEEFLQHTLLTLGNNQPSLIMSLREKASASMRDKRRGISSHLICCATLRQVSCPLWASGPSSLQNMELGLDQCFPTFPAIVSHAILCVLSRRRVLVSVAYAYKKDVATLNMHFQTSGRLQLETPTGPDLSAPPWTPPRQSLGPPPVPIF